MLHRVYDPGTACPGDLKPRYITSSRQPLDVWECDGCGLTNSPYVRRRLRAVWRRLLQSGRIDQFSEPVPGVRQMKIKLSVNRKAGAPGYGSDGAAAEVELELLDELVDTPEKFVGAMLHYYGLIERGVGEQLDKMQAKHPQPEPRPQSRLEGRPAAAQQQPAPEPEPRRWNPDDVPPRPAQRRPEPGWDDQPDEPQRAPERGYGGRNGQRNGSRSDAPRTGRQLLGWAYNHGMDQRLKALAKAWDLGQIVSWNEDNVTAAYKELTRQSTAAGSWGGN